jgi:hypothetical protein
VSKLTKTSQTCPACGSTNDLQGGFCQSCGEPLNSAQTDSQLGINDSAKDDKNIKEIAIGYASSLREGLDNKDSFLVVDLTAVFRGKKHRIILCAIVKGLAKCIDGAVLVGGLLSEILGPHQPNYKEQLVNIQKKFNEQGSTLFTNDEPSKETGLLVSVIDNDQLSTLCINLPCAFIINKTLKQVIKGIEKPDTQMCTLEKGDIVCLACCDILALEGEKDTLNTIAKANNLQIACNTFVSNIQKKKPGCDVSLAIAQVN